MEKTVFFRAFEEGDIDAIYQWKNDDELNKMTVGLNRKICKDDVSKWVRSRMPHNPYEVFWAICANDETQRIIGYTQLTDIHFINSSANFSGIMIGDKNYKDGFAWLEAYMFVMEYAFERLGLNRLYGSSILEHKETNAIGKILFWEDEGIMRQAVFKNGKHYDLLIRSILKNEYFDHKNNGDYEIRSILKRFRDIKHNN
ncbi:MAG: GNAT family N-acetyltransferase [Bacteroidales bacterium]|nr:GNAT family N-acetyltransferase [Bacteroidales bacterium]